MSRIVFHSPSGDREIGGPERAWIGLLCEDVAFGVLRHDVKSLDRFLPADAWPRCAADFERNLGLWVWGGGGNSWLVDGELVDCWQLSLNTVLAIGDDPLRLCARLHGQCELHCYCEGRNRSWLAGIIRRGMAVGIMRRPMMFSSEPYDPGWKSLAGWLESRDDEPVVCSYSVCASFPDPMVAAWSPEEEGDWDSWYDLPREQRWELGMSGLRRSGPELTPDGWAEYRFGHCRDAFWLLDRVMAEQGSR